MSKWKTLKELPEMPKGTVVETDIAGAFSPHGGLANWQPEKLPDFFERIEDEPKFVDVEIKPGPHHRLEVMLPVFVPCFGGHSEYINALPSIPEFVGFVYDTEGFRSESRVVTWSGVDGGPIVHLPTHARFRRQSSQDKGGK